MVTQETIVFAVLFLAQTLIYILLLRRVVTSHGATPPTTPYVRENSSEENDYQGIVVPNAAVEALRLLKSRSDGMTSSDISHVLGRSREHTARAMKLLYERGLVERRGKPFRYYITEKGVRFLDIMENHS